MAVKRFFAADMPTALNNIRNQLGEDAVILATRQLADGVEVSAAAESPELVDTFSKGRREPANAGRTAAALSNSQISSQNQRGENKANAWYLNSISALEDEQSALQCELGSIRSLLEHWMDNQGWDTYASKSPVNAKLWERLRNFGLEAEQINPLLQALDAQTDLHSAWNQVLSSLTQQIPVVDSDIVEAGGVFALLGATGVGKTTTIGKLATRYVLKHGAESVALVTTDRYRIAAHEQLRTLGKILQVTVTAVDDENSLDSVLDSLRNKQLILIDTAGINAAHRNFNEQLLQLNQVSTRITPLLVLAATSQIRVQAAEYAAYTQLNPIAAVITKIDEAASLGESLGLLIANNLPVAYESHGQSIPGDIAVADAQLLVSRAVQISRHKPINKEQMVAGFNAASTNTGSTEASAASIS